MRNDVRDILCYPPWDSRIPALVTLTSIETEVFDVLVRKDICLAGLFFVR